MRGTTLFATISLASQYFIYNLNWQHLYIKYLGFRTNRPSLKVLNTRYIQRKY